MAIRLITINPDTFERAELNHKKPHFARLIEARLVEKFAVQIPRKPGSEIFAQMPYQNACILFQHLLKNPNSGRDDDAATLTSQTLAPIAQLVEQLICNQ